MVRDFEVRPIEPTIVERILVNSLRGPSAGFAQGFDLLVLDRPDQTARFWGATAAEPGSAQRWSGIANAPLVVVLFPDELAYRRRFGAPDKTASLDVPWWLVDTSFAAMTMLHSAVDAGLGAIFFRVNDPAGVRKEFGAPEGRDPIGAVAIGHSRDDRPSLSVARGRRPFDEMVHRGGW
ncbi:MAG: nitroreductase family protein [Actinomycetota bacterium]|nr:nitroreductase family protein [Actinomycetota bacterium]